MISEIITGTIITVWEQVPFVCITLNKYMEGLYEREREREREREKEREREREREWWWWWWRLWCQCVKMKKKLLIELKKRSFAHICFYYTFRSTRKITNI